MLAFSSYPTTVDPSMPERKGVFAGRYEIQYPAGAGGAGVVYRAFDRQTRRIVALKVLHRADAEAILRFDAEANTLGKLADPAIVRYLDHGHSESGEPYLAMQWMEGESLGARLGRTTEGMPIREVALLGYRLAGALATAHAHGVVHRDVKPSNVLLPAEGDVGDAKLADFGIVRIETAAYRTDTGEIVGTVGYFSPEQARGDRDLDGRADLFSLGCLLFRCLTQREPFEGATAVMVLTKVLLEDAPRASELRPDVPAALDALIARMLAKQPDERPASAREVQRELGRIAADLGAIVVPSRSPARWRLDVGLLAALAALWSLLPFFLALRARSPLTPAAVSAPAQVTPSCSPAALPLYEEAMREMKAARNELASVLFARATDVDPSCAEAHLRLLLTTEPTSSRVPPRERLRRAISLRDALSEHDRIVLNAWTSIIGPDSPRHQEAVRILEEGLHRYPDDAELLLYTGQRKRYLATDRESYEAALDLARRAAFVEPDFADAWHLQAMILGYLGRVEDKLDALDRCLEISPGATDCMDDRMLLFKQTGRCEEAATETRRELAEGGTHSSTYWHLAASLASLGSSRASIEEVLTQRWDSLPAEKRVWMALSERVKVAAWMGEFDTALRASEQLARVVSSTSDVDAHLGLAIVSSGLFLELNRTADAARAAEQFLQRRNVWVKGMGRIVGAASYYEPLFLAIALEGGRLTPGAWRKATDDWEEANRTRLNDFIRWVMRWGTAVGSRIDAAEAMAHAPREDAQPVKSSREFVRLIGVMDAYEGRLHLAGGEARAAVPLLERSAHSCNSLDLPFLNMRAHLWLGAAREQLGEIPAACDAYRFIVDRWGNATPHSTTAEEAKQRMRRLRC